MKNTSIINIDYIDEQHTENMYMRLHKSVITQNLVILIKIK